VKYPLKSRAIDLLRTNQRRGLAIGSPTTLEIKDVRWWLINFGGKQETGGIMILNRFFRQLKSCPQLHAPFTVTWDSTRSNG